jgi:sulfide dehydrogenase [flavocytochrome c] flavoprotein subunit
MEAQRQMTRRDVVGGVAASAASLAVACPSFAQSAARIVVIGGGFGGASCARELKRIDPKLNVTLIEPNPTFTACPFSNEVIAGLRNIEAQQFTYERIVAEGVTVVAQAAPGSIRRNTSSASQTAARSPMTGWCCRPAST